jgi:hypothetical protein
MKHKLALSMLSGALLAGCMSAGVEVKPEQMSSFRQGVTTLREVVAELGPPTVQTTLGDGSTLLVYSYVTSRPHPESFIPFIGVLLDGNDTRSSAVVFQFDEHGVLKSANTTTSNVGRGLGSGTHSTAHSAPIRDAEPSVEKSAEPVPAPVPALEETVEPAPDSSSQPE